MQGFRKRFQRDLDKYVPALREHYLKRNTAMNLPTLPKATHLPKAEKRLTYREQEVAKGDLIYITKGQGKGKIVTVESYSKDRDSVYCSEVYQEVVVPKMYWMEGQQSHLLRIPLAIPRANFKLAAKDKDENGKTYYVVADEVVMKGVSYDDRYRQWMPRRFVKHHESVEIPWPTPPDVKEDYLSTSQDAVLEKSYELQTIAQSPLPKGVLSELRNPHSKHKKRVLSEMEARMINGPKMPLSTEQKIYLAKKAAQPEKKLSKLSEEVEDFIGQKVADHLNKITNPALKTHLEALSNVKVPDFEKTIKKIEQ